MSIRVTYEVDEYGLGPIILRQQHNSFQASILRLTLDEAMELRRELAHTLRDASKAGDL